MPQIGDDDDGLVVDPLLFSITGISRPGSGRLSDVFEKGGYYILGTDFGTPTEQKLIFDCGSLGYLSLAAHGHADALSVIFSRRAAVPYSSIPAHMPTMRIISGAAILEARRRIIQSV